MLMILLRDTRTICDIHFLRKFPRVFYSFFHTKTTRINHCGVQTVERL